MIVFIYLFICFSFLCFNLKQIRRHRSEKVFEFRPKEEKKKSFSPFSLITQKKNYLYIKKSTGRWLMLLFHFFFHVLLYIYYRFEFLNELDLGFVKNKKINMLCFVSSCRCYLGSSCGGLVVILFKFNFLLFFF